MPGKIIALCQNFLYIKSSVFKAVNVLLFFLCVCTSMHVSLFVWEEVAEGWMNTEIQ